MEDIIMEKKTYVTPEADKMMFSYRDQVVAASTNCVDQWVNIGEEHCTEGNKHLVRLN